MISLYTLIVIISSFSLLITIVGMYDNYFMPEFKQKSFRILFAMLIAQNWFEWLGVKLNGGAAEFVWLHVLVKFCELSITPFVSIAASDIVHRVKGKKWMYIPAVLNLVLQICSVFTGIVFRIDGANVYSRGPLYVLYVATLVVGAVFMILHCQKFSSKYQHRNNLFLLMIMVMVLLAIALLIVEPSLRMDWTCMTFAAILFYIYYNQLEQQIDPLTALLNRKSYDYAIKHIRKETAIIFFDVDRFKYINDTYGHDFGDRCLIVMAAEMKRIFGKKGYCYRFGGDEACVIIKKNVRDIDALISKYIESINMIREVDKKVPSVSFGYAYFNREKETAFETVKRADEMMYSYKNKHREV